MIISFNIHILHQSCRPGVKDDLTCRDEYLEKRFVRLSSSNHDLTPMTKDEIDHWNEDFLPSYTPFKSSTCGSSSSTVKVDTSIYLGNNQKGVYTCSIGGLPLFSSGSRLPHLCDSDYLVFTEPCDLDHISLVDTSQLTCAVPLPPLLANSYLVKCNRSNQIVGKLTPFPIQDVAHLTYDIIRNELRDLNHYTECFKSCNAVVYKSLTELQLEANSSYVVYYFIILSEKMIFLPLRSKWPIPSQPENYWGTEGMFTVWTQN